ncbi:MAG: hypothetical protein GY716_10755 [bacterium]|nr:hypothetical protein [bacterium]
MSNDSQIRTLLAFYLLMGLALVLPLFLSHRVAGATISLPLFLSWGVVAVSATQLAYFTFLGERRWMSLTFWVFTYVWMGLAGFQQIAHGHFPLPDSFYDDRLLNRTNSVLLLGLGAHIVGFHWRRGSPAPRWVRSLEQRVLDSRRAFVVGICAAGVAVALIILLGGAGQMLTSRREFFSLVADFAGTETQARLRVIFVSLIVAPFVSAYLLWVLWMRKRDTLGVHARLLLVALLAGLVLINVIVNNPGNRARYWFGTIVLSLIFVTLRWSKRLSFPAWSTALIVALLFVFPYADMFRLNLNADAWNYRGMQAIVDEGDYDAFQQTTNALIYVDDNGVRWGRQAAGTFFFFVPRSVWAGKPPASGEMVAQHMGYAHQNLSMPIWGEAYLDGGLPLVLLVCLAYGRLTRLVEDSCVSLPGTSLSLTSIALPVYAAYQLFLLRGSLMVGFAYLVPVLLLFWVHTSLPLQADRQRAELVATDNPATP